MGIWYKTKQDDQLKLC